MPLRVVSLASLLFFASFATAAIVFPDCTNPALTWWANNIGQSPCTIAAYLLSTCSGGSFNIPALPPGAHYTGPKADQAGDLCYCNTVTYSLLSACGACQGPQGEEKWLGYQEFVKNCTKVLAPKTFPNAVPEGTRVPNWALVDVTAEGTWDINKSLTATNNPERLPGTKIEG